MTSIWFRSLFVHLLRLTVLLTLSFFLLFVLFDYAFNYGTVGRLSLSGIINHYAAFFSEMLYCFLPFTFAIGVVRTMTTLSYYKETLAMRVSGSSKRRLLAPFFAVATLLFLFQYTNAQFFQPALTKGVSKQVHALSLPDRSLFIYQKFHPKNSSFYDVYWVKNEKDIYRIERLTLSPTVGYTVDHLRRSGGGLLDLTESHEKLAFPTFPQEHDIQKKARETSSLSTLAKSLSPRYILYGKVTDKEAYMRATLLFKLLFPLAPFFIVMGVAPFSLVHHRKVQTWLIFALTLVSVAIFLMLMRTASAACSYQLLSPLIAFAIPIVLFYALFGVRYAKL